jgi:hypothetical protein
MRAIWTVLPALLAWFSTASAQVGLELPAKPNPKDLWIKAGEMPLSDLLAALSDFASKPLIIGEPGLNPDGEHVSVKEDLKVSSVGPMLSLLREAGFEVEEVVLPNGKVILEVKRARPPGTEASPPIVLKPDSPERVGKSVYITSGKLTVLDMLLFFSTYHGEEVVCEGSSQESVGRLEILNVTDIEEADADLVKEMLQCQGLRLRHVLRDDQKKEWRVYLPPARVPRVIRSPKTTTPAKK